MKKNVENIIGYRRLRGFIKKRKKEKKKRKDETK